MKRFLALLVVLSLALAQGTLPKDARFDQPVIQTGTQVPLSVLLEAMARAVGLSPVLRDIPSITVNADFNQKPFRQVWDLLINTYGDGKLAYVLLDNNVIVVGSPDVVQRAKGQPAQVQTQLPTTPAEPIAREFYQIRSADPTKLADFIAQEIPGVVVRVVPGQSALVVTGTGKQQADVSTLLQRVDLPVVASVPLIQKSFALSHAKAADLKTIIEQSLGAQEQAQSQAQGQAQTATAASIPKAAVAAEPRTNTLIVTGTADQIAQVERLIPQLDRPIQQVQLQIRVQSVNSEVFRNLGIKWDTIAGGNLVGSIFGSASQGLNLIFDVTKSLSSLNIKAVLDALEGQSLSRRLSDANVLVLDNYGNASDDIRGTGAKGAEVKVGGRLLIPITVGDQISVREFDYGLIVRVRPQITNDGNIILEVYTQTGDDPAAGPSNSIRVPQQSTLSSLRIRDGQTLVLGGLIQQTSSETVNQVPILGSIPLLGELFKTRSNSTKSDELIVIITANIVKDAATK